MKYLWLIWLPLLFLPNAGAERSTPFGTLTIADFLIFPYIFFIYWQARHRRILSRSSYLINALVPILTFFIIWILFSTALMPLRYLYINNDRFIFSLLKIGKFSLYIYAAILTIQALARSTQGERQVFYWVLLLCGVLVGTTLLISQNSLGAFLPAMSAQNTIEVYQSNGISALMAIMLSFIAGMVLTKGGSSLWRRFALLGLVVMMLGFLMAQGRGGWVAALVSIAYVFTHINLRRTALVAILGVAVVTYAYIQFPIFRGEVNRTLWPDELYLATYNAGIYGMDDGGRWTILKNEVPKILEAPLLGRGFFHRGGLSGIYSTGSHNFFLQIFLETGIPGGILMLTIFHRMWQHAGIQQIDQTLTLPVRAALVSATIAGLSGEYFYGGTIIFTLFLIYAPIGSLPIATVTNHSSSTLTRRRVSNHITILPTATPRPRGRLN